LPVNAGEGGGTSERKDTPAREGTKGTVETLMVNIPLEKAIAESELIVDVTITEWLGEMHSENERYGVPEAGRLGTYYSAKVNRTVKGEEYETIVLQQAGNSEWTIEGYPLFKNGDRLFLFLAEEQDEDKTKFDTEKIFGILGMYQTSFVIWERENKNYVLSMVDYGVAEDISADKRVRKESNEASEIIAKDYIKQNPVFEKEYGAFGSVFSYKDFVKIISQEVG
jgi:hypothetical protein